MSNDNRAVLILVALRKAVMLRDKYNEALQALADTLAGQNLDGMTQVQIGAMSETIDSLTGIVENYSDIGPDCVAMLERDWLDWDAAGGRP